MIKKIMLLAALSTQAWSAMIHPFPAAGTSLEYILLPKDSQILVNQFFWTINANCTISSEVEENILGVKILKKNGYVNDLILNAGDSIDLALLNNSVVRVSAPPGSKVELTNLGEEAVQASCEAY